MLVDKTGRVQHLTVGEHSKYKNVVFSSEFKIELTNDKKLPFRVMQGDGPGNMYIDLFALNFGYKERLKKTRQHRVDKDLLWLLASRSG